MSTPSIGNIKQVACGLGHTFVLTEDNQLWACGWNRDGQLGLNDKRSRDTLTKLNWTGGAIRQVACGSNHTIVLAGDSQLWACGHNREGQLGLGYGDYKNTLTKLNWTGGAVKQIACGADHTFVLTQDNQLWACGDNLGGQLGLGDRENKNKNILTKLNWTGGAIKQIDCAGSYTFVLTEDNQLWACGSNRNGQLGLGDDENRNSLTKLNWTNGPIKQIACGSSHTFVLTEDNKLWACGRNGQGQLSLGDRENRNILALLNWTGGAVKQIVCSYLFTFVLTKDNQLWACGYNRNGQLGLGDNHEKGILTKLNWTGGTVKQVACGKFHTFILTEDSQLWACGDNRHGQLGLGDDDSRSELTEVPTISAEERRAREEEEHDARIKAQKQKRQAEAMARVRAQQEAAMKALEQETQEAKEVQEQRPIVKKVNASCENKEDYFLGQPWAEFDDNKLDDVVVIVGTNRETRNCFIRQDLIERLTESDPIYGLPTYKLLGPFYVNREDALRKLQTRMEGKYMSNKFQIEDTGNKDTYSGRSVQKLVPMDGPINQPPPPLPKPQEGGSLNYKRKYLKYKAKYLNLRHQI